MPPRRRASDTADAELTEAGRLFRAKVQQLQYEQDRASRRARKLAVASRRRSKLDAVDTPPSDDELLSTAELARLLNVSPKTVALWAADGGLPSFRTLGGHRRYRWVDVKRWLNRAAAASL